jgi:prolyl oligopeptidase
VTIADNFLGDTGLIESDGDTLFLVTNIDAPNKKIVTVNAKAPTRKNWQDLIPETEHVLSASTGGGYFFAEYMVDAISQVVQYDYQGNKVRDIKLPGVGSSTAIAGEQDAETLYYSFSNYKTPSTIYSFNIDKGESALYRKSGAKFDSDAFESK